MRCFTRVWRGLSPQIYAADLRQHPRAPPLHFGKPGLFSQNGITCPQSIPFYHPEFTTAFIKCGGRALAGFFIGGFISAFARCCFRIADNLLVLTSPMTSPLSLLCQSCCVNGGPVAPPCQTKNYQSLHFFRPSNTGKCIIASK